MDRPTRRDRPGPEDPGWARRLGAELFGTFALVFVAAGGGAMASVSGGQISPAARAVAPGLMVAALIYAIGDRSGAHFNPAVSLAFTLKRLFPVRWLLPYWGAQILGALAASVVIALLFGNALDAGITTPHVPDMTAAALEAILTLLLVTVILGTADRHRIVGSDAAIAVGGTIALAGLIAGPISGASMNPARSLGPALVAGQLGSIWVYIVGPIAGAAAAVALAWFLHGSTEDDPAALDAARGDPADGPPPGGSPQEFPAREPGARGAT